MPPPLNSARGPRSGGRGEAVAVLVQEVQEGEVRRQRGGEEGARERAGLVREGEGGADVLQALDLAAGKPVFAVPRRLLLASVHRDFYELNAGETIAFDLELSYSRRGHFAAARWCASLPLAAGAGGWPR